MRKTVVLILAAISFLSCVRNVDREEKAPEVEYDLFLLLGQSNMVGYAPLEEGDLDEIRGVFLLDADGKIIPASSPINRFSTIRFMGDTFYGLGPAFARKLRFETGRYILLMSNARGGSAIAEWQKDCAYNFYAEALRRTEQALAIPGVRLKGIIWHQGESDCTRQDFEEYYYEKLGQMVEDFRRDLDDPTLPIVIGETYYGASYAEMMNPVIDKVSDYLEYSSFASAEGCGTLGDNIHFSHQGYDIIGERYAEEMLKLCYGR